MQEKLLANEVLCDGVKLFLIPLRKDKGQQQTQTDLEQQTASICRVFQRLRQAFFQVQFWITL